MRARLLVVSALAALACVVVAPAHAAATPCWKKVFSEWSRTNKISDTYPLHCYHEALAHLKDFPDANIYSSFADDVHSALAAAVARRSHKKPPSSYVKQLQDAKQHTRTSTVGTTSTGRTPTHPVTTATTRRTRTASTPAATTPRKTATTPTTSTGATASSDDGGGGGGIPTPLLILGAIALALLAAGAVGGAVRFNRTRRGA